MSKFSKFLFYSALAGAAAYGAYTYLQKKQTVSCAPSEDADEDFDDFSEDLDEDLSREKDRSYVSLNLDKAEAFASEAIHKAKEVITDSVQQVKETVKNVADAQACHSSFTDLTPHSKNPSVQTAAPILNQEAPSEKEVPEKASGEAPDETVEEFFDDDPSL